MCMCSELGSDFSLCRYFTHFRCIHSAIICGSYTNSGFVQFKDLYDSVTITDRLVSAKYNTEIKDYREKGFSC